jgi:glutaredoxin
MDAGTSKREAAPVVVYHLDKHRRDLGRFTEVLDASDIPYRVISLEGDAATTEAVRRDAGGRKLPLVFIAGDCVGGREELNAMDRSGELKRRVWGA